MQSDNEEKNDQKPDYEEDGKNWLFGICLAFCCFVYYFLKVAGIF